MSDILIKFVLYPILLLLLALLILVISAALGSWIASRKNRKIEERINKYYDNMSDEQLNKLMEVSGLSGSEILSVGRHRHIRQQQLLPTLTATAICAVILCLSLFCFIYFLGDSRPM